MKLQFEVISYARTHTHARMRILWPSGLCPGLPWWAGTRKVKPIWILLKQEWQWAICKSAPHPSNPLLSFFTEQMPFQPSNQQHQRSNQQLTLRGYAIGMNG